MWVDAEDMWEPTISEKLEKEVFQTAFAIGYAENECVQTHYPANNPIKGVPELSINNPMTPLVDSFWSTTMRPYCSGVLPETAASLIEAVDRLFMQWKKLFKEQTVLPLARRTYMLDDRGVQLGAGIVQIRAYAEEAKDKTLLAHYGAVAQLLASARSEFFGYVSSSSGLNYFGAKKKSGSVAVTANKALA